MPGKGQKLSKEHREKLDAAKAAGKAAQTQADQESRQLGEVQAADAEAQKAVSQAEALARQEEVRRQMLSEADRGSGRDPNVAIHQPSHVPTGGGARQSVSEWGPYNTYVLAETPYGRYAVEPGFVMFFEEYDYFNSREQRMMKSHRPVYVWYGSGPEQLDPETGEVLVPADKNFGRTRDEILYKVGGATKPTTADRPHVDSQAPASV